jgi:hypothetical protein
MGKQYNKIIKRRRRGAYLERKKSALLEKTKTKSRAKKTPAAAPSQPAAPAA